MKRKHNALNYHNELLSVARPNRAQHPTVKFKARSTQNKLNSNASVQSLGNHHFSSDVANYPNVAVNSSRQRLPFPPYDASCLTF